MYQRSGSKAIKKDLTNTYALLKGLGNPHEKLKCVHIAGTNGKGTSAHSIAAVLQAAGYKAGLYTSPHLKHFTERMRINGQPASEGFVVRFVNENKSLIETVQPSFFEVTVAMAFQCFHEQQVDIAVVEVGLGGTLDSTNVITPLVSLITQIGFDHQELLGDTLEQIASEKAGIIKKGIPVVIGDNHDELRGLFQRKADSINSPIEFASDSYQVSALNNKVSVTSGTIEVTFDPDIKGAYYKNNLAGTLGVIDQLQHLGYDIGDDYIIRGLSNVTELTGLKGRWQILGDKPLTICDVGHNEDGLESIVRQLKELEFDKLFIVFGGVNDKPWDDLLPLLPKEANYVLCQPNIPRAIAVADLAQHFKKHELNHTIKEDVNEAIAVAKSQASEKDVIFIGGSTFVVAEINDL